MPKPRKKSPTVENLEEFSVDFPDPANPQDNVHAEGRFLPSDLEGSIEIDVVNINDDEIDLSDELEDELLDILRNHEY